jgi:hypothetical protein
MQRLGIPLKLIYKNGDFRDLSRNIKRQFKPLDTQLMAIVEAGGWHANFEKRLANLSAN